MTGNRTPLHKLGGVAVAAAVLGGAPVVGQVAEPGYEWYKEVYDPGEYLFNYDIFKDWDIHFDHSLAYEMYPLRGDVALGPYQEPGAHGYYEFNAVGSREFSPFKRMRTQVSGVYNVSDYRSESYGLVPERISLLKEDGEVDVPYRMEFGNFYGEFSARTLQSSLKGGVIEFQPQQNWYGERHSMQFLTGSGVTRWDKESWDDDLYMGASWLIDATDVGADGKDYGVWSLNWIRNTREQKPLEGFSEVRTQDVLTVAAAKDFTGPLDQIMSVEGEYGAFLGDHEQNNGASDDQNNHGIGRFVQLTGSDPNLPLDYRLRYENYSMNYAPFGASTVTPDFLGTEAHVGWRFDKGIRMRLRDLRYRTSRSTGNQTQTITDGITFTGPLFAYFNSQVFRERFSDVTGALDIYRRRTADSTNGVTGVLRVFDLSLNSPLPRDWTGRFGFKVQDDHDIDAESTLLTKEVSFSADHAVSFRDWSGTITPGLILRMGDGQDTDTYDLQPSVGLNVSKGRHSLTTNAGLYVQESLDTPDADTVDVTFSGAYAYTLGPHVFRLEADHLNRDINNTGHTDQTRIAFFWRYNYDKPSAAAQARLKAAAAVAALPTDPTQGLRVGQFPPGTALSDVQSALAARGVEDSATQPGATLFETPLFRDQGLRQRLAMVHGEDGNVTTSGVIIEFEDTTNVGNMQRAYARILSDLLARYASPTNSYEDGVFTANLAPMLLNGNFRRITEWTRSDGTIRFGIPRRLDNTVRMEVLYAKSFPPASAPVWGLTNIR